MRRYGGGFYRDNRARAVAMGLKVRGRWPAHVLSFGGGLGDDLLCTAVAREMKKRSPQKVGIISRYPELFENNKDFDSIWAYRTDILSMARLGLLNLTVPWYTQRDPADAHQDKDIVPTRHIIALMCSYAGLAGEICLRPYWHFRPGELESGKFAAVQVAIQSTGLSKDAAMPLKEWYPARFQQVVDRLSPSVTFVQIGRAADYPLKNVVDLRGKTTVRETAAVLAHSQCFVGLVGFSMHLARAVECRSVIVYGGREAPQQSGYGANINLFRPEPCAPCWRWSRCDYARACMDKITPTDVVAGIERVLNEAIAELPVDKDTIVSMQDAVEKKDHLGRLEWGMNRRYLNHPPGSR